jgi:hypothetical protein
MIIFTKQDGAQIAIRPSSIVTVETDVEEPSNCFVEYVVNSRNKEPEIVCVKHTVQEVVDALNKINAIWG